MIRWQILVALAFAAWLFVKNLPGALLCLFPGLLCARETDDDGSLDPSREPAMERIAARLTELGFARVGAIQIRPPLSAGSAFLVYASPERRAFADVSVLHGSLAVTFLTPYADGAAVATSDYRRPAIARPDYLAGGLPGQDLPELWAVHRRRVEHFRATPPDLCALTLEGRLEADAALDRGPARRELRLRSSPALLVALVALALILVGALQLARQIR